VRQQLVGAIAEQLSESLSQAKGVTFRGVERPGGAPARGDGHDLPRSSPSELSPDVQEGGGVWPTRVLGLRIDRLVEYAIGGILAVTLLAYMLIGNYTRYVADDYGLAIAVRLRGYWAQQVADYQLTDGHFIATALTTAATLVNPVFVRILPGILILGWVALLALGLRFLIPSAGRLGRLLIAAGIAYTTLRVTPNPFLAVYWMTASLEFVVPLLLASVFIWLITRPRARGRRRTMVLILIGAVAFVAAGEAEIYTAGQTVALTLAVAASISRLSPEWRRKLPELGVAWIGSLAGLTAELIAPGAGLRSAVIAKIVVVPRPSLIGLPAFTLGQMGHFLQLNIVPHWRGLLGLAVLAALIASRSAPARQRLGKVSVVALAIATAGIVLVVLGTLAPAALYFGSLPPLYDQLIPVYVCTCATASAGWLAGRFLRERFDVVMQRAGSAMRFPGAVWAATTLVLGAIVVAGPIGTLAMLHGDLPALRSYAAGKDTQTASAEAARAAGRSSVDVPALVNVEDIGIFSHTPLEELSTDPNFWINGDEANYYGLVSMAMSQQSTP